MQRMADDGSPELSVRALIGQLAQDARSFAQAEAEYVRAELGARASLLVPALVMLICAAVLGFGALITLLLGLAMALARLIGALAASFVVVLLALALAFLLYRVAVMRLRRAFQTGPER